MSADGLTEKLIGCFDCKQGAVRAVRFNGECVSCSPCVASPARKLTRGGLGLSRSVHEEAHPCFHYFA